MDFSNLPPQKHFFYNRPWNKSLDKAFLDCLITQMEVYPQLKFEAAPAEALLAVKDILNEDPKINLDWEDLYCRLNVLRERYATFKWLLAFEGTSWDRESNRVFTSDHNWEKIFMTKPMAKAYYSHGEPLYNNMMILFALDNVKHEEVPNPVINLDDEDDKSVEVTSPPLNSRCRRLFDSPSNTNACPGPNFYPKKPNFLREKSGATDRKGSPSHGQSSTASTSPLMWRKP